MEYIVFLSLVMLTGIAQGRILSPLPYDDVRDPPSTVDTQDNRHNEIMRNISWNEANDELYQGDIVLTYEQKRAMVERKAMKDETSRWPKSADGTVNIDYRFADTVVDRSVVELAMSRWHQATCVKFNEITAPVAKPHLIIVTHSFSCDSYLGYVSSKPGQELNLAPRCFVAGEGVVVHELGHALGLHHEQSRSDRDDYVYVMTDNIKAGYESEFKKEDTNNYDLPYDYSSMMHYYATQFSKNGRNTVVAKDPLAQPLITRASKFLSFMDKKLVNLMYKCTDTWLAKCNLAATPCMNQGYTKSDCSCECPAGTSGANCETLNQPYIDALIDAKSPGSQRITTEGTVTSPGYPVPVATVTSRVQSIVAPLCHKVKLTFTDFNMPGTVTMTYSTGVVSQECYFMILEIRLDDPPITGTKYCETNIKATQTFESVGRSMVLTFSTAAGGPTNTFTGYSATVQFVPVTTGNCPGSSSSEGATPPAVKQP